MCIRVFYIDRVRDNISLVIYNGSSEHLKSHLRRQKNMLSISFLDLAVGVHSTGFSLSVQPFQWFRIGHFAFRHKNRFFIWAGSRSFIAQNHHQMVFSHETIFEQKDEKCQVNICCCCSRAQPPRYDHDKTRNGCFATINKKKKYAQHTIASTTASEREKEKKRRKPEKTQNKQLRYEFGAIHLFIRFENRKYNHSVFNKFWCLSYTCRKLRLHEQYEITLGNNWESSLRLLSIFGWNMWSFAHKKKYEVWCLCMQLL